MRMSFRLVAASAALGLAALAGRANAQGTVKPTVAVMYFNNNAMISRGEFEALRVGVADVFISEMRANSRITVVERDQLNKLLEEQNLVSDRRVDAETAARLGKVLGAQHMIFGGFIVDQRGTMRIDARAINVETSALEFGETVTGKSEDVLELIASLAGKFNTGLRLPAMDRRARSPGEAPAGGRYAALMTYSRALVEDDRKNTKQAADYYREFLRTTPATFAVEQRRQAQARLQALGGSDRER
jgi:hypothetical protein